MPSVSVTARSKVTVMRSMWPSASASPVSLAVITALAGMPSVTLTAAVCVLAFPGVSVATPAPEKLTVPVSSPPIVAARVATTTASLAVPVAMLEAAALAPPVKKVAKTISAAASVASAMGSENVTSTVVRVFVCADTIAGPALSVDAAATLSCAGTPVAVSMTRPSFVKATFGVAPVS